MAAGIGMLYDSLTSVFRVMGREPHPQEHVDRHGAARALLRLQLDKQRRHAGHRLHHRAASRRHGGRLHLFSMFVLVPPVPRHRSARARGHRARHQAHRGHEPGAGLLLLHPHRRRGRHRRRRGHGRAGLHAQHDPLHHQQHEGPAGGREARFGGPSSSSVRTAPCPAA